MNVCEWSHPKLALERLLRALVAPSAGLSIAMTVLFVCGLHMLPVNQAYAEDCVELKKKIKNYKNDLKAWERSKEKHRAKLKKARDNLQIGGKFSVGPYTFEELAAICVITEDERVEWVNEEGEVEGRDCAPLVEDFFENYQAVKSEEFHVKQISENMRDLNQRISRAEAHYFRSCPDSPLSEPSGEYWEESGVQGWTGKWTRRGDSHVFDVVWSKGSYSVNATVTFTVSGNQWKGVRTTSSDNVICNYRGTLSDDGNSIEGDGDCPSNNTTFQWRATIHRGSD